MNNTTEPSNSSTYYFNDRFVPAESSALLLKQAKAMANLITSYEKQVAQLGKQVYDLKSELKLCSMDELSALRDMNEKLIETVLRLESELEVYRAVDNK